MRKNKNAQLSENKKIVKNSNKYVNKNIELNENMQLNENASIKERENMNKNKYARKKQKVIQINAGFMILKIIAIIIIISLITAQTVRTIIQARTSTNEAETTEEEATYYMVDSTEIDEETGEYIQVPVPVGYTASEIIGETGVSTGFVIYEGEIDWSEIIVDEDTSTESGSEDEATDNSASDAESTAQTTVVETSVSQSEAETIVNVSTDEDGQTESEDSNENASKDLATDDTTNSTSDGATSENSEEDEATNSASEISDEGTENTTENGTSIISDEDLASDESSDEEVTTYTVTVYYLDEDTLEEIADTVTTTYSEGDTYETEQLEIEGYTYSSVEGEVSGTVTGDITVIYYYTEDETYYLSEYYSEEESEAIWDLQTSTNQWVWVPVSEEDLETIYGVDENGKYWGKLYSNYSTTLNWKETDGIMSITSSTSNREPDVTLSLTAYDTDEYLTSYLNQTTRYELLTELEENFYETIESIRKYGGFYIGRYETGNLSNSTAAVIKNNSDTGSKTWYVMYEKCESLSGENTNVTTSMIWGCLWDYTLRWLVDSEATISTGKTITTDIIWGNDGVSRSWGNYGNAEFTYYTDWDTTEEKSYGTTGLYLTGCTDYAKVNNIYDLAGNESERTLESYSTDYRVWRGGDGASTTDHAAGCRSIYGYSPYSPTITSACLRGSSHTLFKVGYPEILYPEKTRTW